MRFLREFDKADRDASASAAVLQDWIVTCRRLFVEGWIMVPPAKLPSESTGEGGESTIPEKTITQIIFEQLDETIDIRYGNERKRIYKSSSRGDCTSALADMGSIVEDAIARVEVDFQGLYMDLMALNVDAWRRAIAKPENRARLIMAARHLCTAFKLPFVAGQWTRMIHHLYRTQRSTRHTDSRVIWAVALATSQGTDMAADMEALRPLITFFVAWTDGTGSVERFLGAHASFLQAHCGGDDMASGAAETCLEVAKEGPSTEAEMFGKVDGV